MSVTAIQRPIEERSKEVNVKPQYKGQRESCHAELTSEENMEPINPYCVGDKVTIHTRRDGTRHNNTRQHKSGQDENGQDKRR